MTETQYAFTENTFTLIRYYPLFKENLELRKKVDHLNHVKAGYRGYFAKKKQSKTK